MTKRYVAKNSGERCWGYCVEVNTKFNMSLCEVLERAENQTGRRLEISGDISSWDARLPFITIEKWN